MKLFTLFVTLLGAIPAQIAQVQQPNHQPKHECPPPTAIPLLEKFGVITQDTDCFFNNEGDLSIVVESPNVIVNGRRTASYKFSVTMSGARFVVTEKADGLLIFYREFFEGFDFQLLFFGETGYIFSPTTNTKDFRVVEPLGRALRAAVVMKAAGQKIFLGDGAGPFKSFEKRLTLEGRREILTDNVVKLANDIEYSRTNMQQDNPAIKYLRLFRRAAVGTLPTDFANDNFVVRGPGTVAGLVAQFISLIRPDLPASPVTDALNSIAANLQRINGLPADRDPRLRAIDVEIVSAKIFKLHLCILARADGSLGDASGGLLDKGDFGECIDEIDDLGEDAVGLTPDCTKVCAAPRPFSIDRCRDNAPNTFNGIQPMEELCDVFEAFRPEVLQGPNGPRAAEFVEDMERNFADKFERIWTKTRNYCGCP